ncbi:MAG: hypothetical protein M3362_26285 [Acidobacteriota bacterium]|nr:hypothetical protein [Acidobacteriota bacterium]
MSENRNTGGFNQGQTGGGTSSTGGSNTGTTGTSGQSLATTGGQGAGTAAAPAEDKGYGAKIADAASTAKDYVADKVSAIGDKLSELKNTDIKEVANQAKDYARQNPGQAILISAAAGLVLGLLIRGSRR